MRTAKKGQVSWFVAIGLVLLIVILLLTYVGFSLNFFSKEAKQQITADQQMQNLQSYIESCELSLAQEAFIKIGNQGGKIITQNYFAIGKNKIEIAYDGEQKLSTLEDIAKDIEKYFQMNLARFCKPEKAIEKPVESSTRIQAKINFNDKETIMEITWPVTVTFENNTKKIIDKTTINIPIRMKTIHEAITQDLKDPYTTNLNFVDSLDNMDIKAILYPDDILNFIIDHKSQINNRPYKFFYVEKVK